VILSSTDESNLSLAFTGCWALRKHLVVIASVSANPFCVAGDGFLAVFYFYGDDVVTCSVSDLLERPSTEVCQEVFRILFPVRMQQVAQ